MISQNNIPLLSICIPTYNRAEILDRTLASITSEDIFQNTSKIEVVISDNCSEDNTSIICNKYTALFPDKIRYIKTECNIGADANFIKVLEEGRGALLKLCNDSCIFIPGALGKMLSFVEKNINEKPVLFFTNTINKKYINSDICTIDSFNQFVEKIGHRMTWIGSYSIWKEDFESFDNIARGASLGFFQTDALLRQIAAGKKVIVNNEAFFNVPVCSNKGGYNPAVLFGKNYLLKILYPYTETGILDKKVFEKEKRRVLKDTILPYCLDIKNEYCFITENYINELMDVYGRNSYFYTDFTEMYFKKIIYRLFGPLLNFNETLNLKAKLKIYSLFKNEKKLQKYRQKLEIAELNKKQRCCK